MKTINGIRYYNCGDWVESCTAIVEDMAGNLDIVTWTGSDVDHAEKVIYLDNEDSAPGDGKDRKVA
jgi:hypothetical protein